MRATVIALTTAVVLGLPASSVAAPAGNADVAALQVALHAAGLYGGDIDGLTGDLTIAALRRLPGATTPLAPQTRAAVGTFASHVLGSRPLALGATGWDAAALQFLLAWHGFPSGVLDGTLGPRTEAALVRFQLWAGLPPIGVAGPRTLAALRTPPAVSPIRLAAPVGFPPTDGFGPRGVRFHTGLDYPAPVGTPVLAAGEGTVAGVGWDESGYGRFVLVDHGGGVTTMYAHLSESLVRQGERVAGGTAVGAVGATGHATGPHLHFEVRVRGAAIDPLTALRND